ncbi:pyroglutamyl-peptidase I [Kribbella alba]|uniref:Pyrrolidone-carboxylate peptidase n=1 Tax=Kribbella alba TaxID=190197 RepID=A0ABN2FPB8_9ACTN
MISPKVLLTGFTPFGGDKINPSWLAVRQVAEARPTEVRAVEIPTVFATAISDLEAAIRGHRPEVVICVGLANGRPAITPERVAININDADLEDNAGEQPIDVPIVPGGPAAYFTNLPLKDSVAAMRAAGLPAKVSDTAGTFVCNNIFYGLMHLIATKYPGLRGGFIHVPHAPEQVPDGNGPSLSIEQIAQGVSIMVDTCLAPGANLVQPHRPQVRSTR